MYVPSFIQIRSAVTEMSGNKHTLTHTLRIHNISVITKNTKPINKYNNK